MFKEKIFEQEEGLLDNEPFLFRVKEPMPNSSITVFAMGTAPASRSRCTAVALKKGLKFDRIRELQGAESVRRIEMWHFFEVESTWLWCIQTLCKNCP